ncbi:NAD-dependent epimerase/dehydratase family protein [Pararhizobium sp.]|uniref:NAD-dependent epimerase/dehydratase family protein n=1 Tax=Pararhizobium sp. TaxID=1977563 RepID=UPI002723C8A6|nr:NAD-dependent epimerase/dehydratase family protein [Pararhizobium sp.]MDO9416581.1 NAD-dependent epimerase/dehydratase family protein [Pararhizobium sp.]
MTETVLITGGTGYVAGWCIADLLKRGYRVRTTVRDLVKEADLRAAIAAEAGTATELSFHIADLLSDEGWDAALDGCDYVLHTASPLGGGDSRDRYSLVAPARDGTLRVLRAAVKAGVKRVVMTSAAATARPPLDSGITSNETVWADAEDSQFDSYRVSKILAEKAAWDFMAEQGGTTEFSTILPGAVFGPVLSGSQQGSVTILNDLLHGRPAAMPRLGFWVVDVRDLADVHIRAMTSANAKGERFIAVGDFMWMEEIAKALRAGLGARGRKVPKLRMPDFMVRFLLPFLPQLKSIAPLIGRKFPIDAQKARTVLGFAPRPGAVTVVECAESLLSHRRA